MPEKFENLGHSIHFIRHGKAEYRSIKEILKSDDPQQGINPEIQELNDLTEEGKELALEEAKKFFSKLDPKKDAIFFVSSNMTRALETANIYKEVALQGGFEIIKPEHTTTKSSEDISGGEIKILKNLSLNIQNVLLSEIFNPEIKQGDINWQAVDEETKTKWQKAREIIETDNKHSWGENFFYYSKAVREIFPELKTTQDLYDTNFRNLIRLAKFGFKKIQESKSDKNIKVICFGHENYMGYALNKYFGEHAINNCEVIDISISEDGGLLGSFRDQTKGIE